MKTNILALFAILATVFYSCQKDPSTKEPVDYSKLVTIKQGVWGSCTYLTGDCMPMVGGNSSCKSEPVKRTIYIYASTADTQAVKIGTSFYSQINTTLIAQTQSADNGFFQISLQPGKYSVLVLEQGKFYCMDWGDPNLLAPLTINSNATTKRDVVIDMAVH